MTNDLSVISLIFDASIPVQIVMLLLTLASLVSWTIIFTKRRLIRRTRSASPGDARKRHFCRDSVDLHRSVMHSERVPAPAPSAERAGRVRMGFVKRPEELERLQASLASPKALRGEMISVEFETRPEIIEALTGRLILL